MRSDKLAQEQLSRSACEADAMRFPREYQPEAVCRLVKKVRVFEDGRLQITLKNQDVFQRFLGSERNAGPGQNGVSRL